MIWEIGNRRVETGERTFVMGIVNVTPDSFSDGGYYINQDSAFEHALQLAHEGADILDIGGESTRPGAHPVSLEEEIDRVIPVLKRVREALPDLLLSVDTYKAGVAEEALRVGVDIINDVSAGQADPDMLPLAAASGAGLVLMHMKGRPETMQNQPTYKNVVEEVVTFLEQRVQAAVKAGVKKEQLCLDPGIGFGKTFEQNLQLIAGLGRLKDVQRPLLLGVSRKKWLGDITEREVGDRLAASLGGAAACVGRGANILRVHDVIETCDMVKILDRVNQIQLKQS